MFDLTSSKLLILGIVALIVVGPKELPFLLRTIGKYVGMIRRQANEFRAQFDEAMREAELDSIKKEVEAVARDAENTIRDAQTTVERDMHATQSELDQSLRSDAPVEPNAHTFDPLNGLDVNSTAVVVPNEPPSAPPPSSVVQTAEESASEPLIEHAEFPPPVQAEANAYTVTPPASYAKTGT